MVGESKIVLPADALAALQTGNKIQAIKALRTHAGLGLKEAKDAVDAHVAAHPELQEILRSRSSGALGWIVMLLLAAAAVVYFWPK